ncbi:hypothetical protein GH714_014393 [Hevea brasiliensis]|uniref:Uncharacterized protein n=1 Tax=Hevea brasiliensis TaxID=3981 RepID=A0A6A6L3B8_HEVBR|nr:hypothetical protein GH714_014393 [Hevea brasiliensis]
MKAAAVPKKEREEGTEVENSNDETETVAERARKRKGKGIAGSEPSAKKKKMEKALLRNLLCNKIFLSQDEGESSKKKEKMKLKMSDFVKISKANLDMMKEIKEMSGLTLNILEKSHELQKGIMAEHNAKMDMLINRLDRQEWFMKKMAQMLFGESFGKFGDFGSYPQGTAGPSNAKAAGSSG